MYSVFINKIRFAHHRQPSQGFAPDMTIAFVQRRWLKEVS